MKEIKGKVEIKINPKLKAHMEKISEKKSKLVKCN